MNFMEMLNDNWYIVGIGIIYIALKYIQISDKYPQANKSAIPDYIEILIYLLIITIFQDKFFNEHYYFIISMIIFIPVYVTFIYWILNRGNYYLIESRLQGQEFYKMGLIPESENTNSDLDKDITLNTGIRVHIMDKELYESKLHFGDDFTPRYNAGDRVKFCDYFDGNTIYHPEYPDLRNISFWSRVVEFVHLKDLIPDLMRENLKLTDLANVKIYHNIRTMRNNLKTTLTGLETQYNYEPYNIENKLKEHLEKEIKNKHKSLSESETKESIKNEMGDSENE